MAQWSEVQLPRLKGAETHTKMKTATAREGRGARTGRNLISLARSHRGLNMRPTILAQIIGGKNTPLVLNEARMRRNTIRPRAYASFAAGLVISRETVHNEIS